MLGNVKRSSGLHEEGSLHKRDPGNLVFFLTQPLRAPAMFPRSVFWRNRPETPFRMCCNIKYPILSSRSWAKKNSWTWQVRKSPGHVRLPSLPDLPFPEV